MIIPCGGDKCDRLLYVEVKKGEQVLYCYLCNSANAIEFKDDGEADE